ncbi:MAG: PilC/PilY family type IV pilus protein [Burkholderiaceae bacterium]
MGLADASLAASTDIATAPLSTSSPTAVKPNLMFTLDDSGSMASAYMPDTMSSSGKYGYWSPQCNGVAYDRSIQYPLPIDSTGVALAAGSMSAFDVDTGNLNDRENITSAAPTIGLGPVTVTVASWNNFVIGEMVTIYSNTTKSNWMVGTLTATTATTLTVNVIDTSGSGALGGSPRIARGDTRPFYYTYGSPGVQPKLSWVFTASGVVADTFHNECMSNIGSTPGSNVFTKTSVSATSGPAGFVNERQNYANWSAYYSTRMKMMQTGVSLAFKGIDANYRVGFNKISKTSVTGSGFVNIADFDAAQKLSFYTALNAATPDSSTPLRGALSKVGQYFANKRSGQTVDPVQYSCQKNFHILSTDGYWNTGDESSSYGPKALDNSTNVGQQDGAALRPLFDGISGTATITESWTTTNTSTSTVLTPVQIVDTSTSVTTTTTPATGWSRNQYTTWTSTARSNSSVARCGTSGPPAPLLCTITVGLTNHGYNVNDSVVIAGVTTNSNLNNFYNGTFVVTSVPSANTFTYQTTYRPNSDTSNGTSKLADCSAGQVRLTTQEQRYDESTVSIATTVSTTTSTAEQRDVTSTMTVTPHTITFDVVNGVVTNPQAPTVDGTPTTSSPTVATDLINLVVPSPVVGLPTITSGSNVFGTPTNFGAPVKSNACVAMPSPNPSNPVAGAPSTNVPTSNTPPPTPGTPTTTPGTPGPAVAGTLPPVDSAHTSVTVVNTTGGGPSDTLADVAMYYYQTDLRTAGLSNCTGAPVGTPAVSNDVCANNVAPRGSDAASWQHVTTFTLGLGASGILKYDPNYLTQTSGDFFGLKQGTINWPVPVAGSGENPANIDDLWHAAVNGRGQYFSATNPASLASGLNGALAGIQAKLGSASAAAASNLQPVLGDNKLFVAQYVTGLWTGDVVALTINPVTGVIDSTTTNGVTTPTISWSAKAKLDARVAAIAASAPGNVPRQIYYFKNTSGNMGQLRNFTYANLGTDTLTGHVDNVCSKSPALSQCSTVDTTAANLGSNLVNWLRGIDNNPLYRPRSSPTVVGGSVLGDIVGGAPIYVSKPPFSYTEHGYAAWASTQASRPGTVFVAANDGMLHAFDGSTGEERWAFMPSAVLPNLYKLADFNYAALHQYLVDGAPVIGDVWDGTNWKTILVGGLGAGGRSYYALDITDPTNPVAMWEFTDTHLGLTFGNPVITKRADGTWVVVFGSGHNNNVSGGDGNGRMFVVDALTGSKITAIQTFTSGSTAAGTVGTPSGLAKINVWVDSNIDNTAKRFYGGDLLGNVWRFDIDNIVAPNSAALRLANLQVSGVPQPITTQVSLAEVTYSTTKYPVVYVGTGRYLGASDLSNTAVQSVYALKDPLTATGLGDVHNNSTLVEQTLTETTDANGAIIKTGTKNPVNWSTKNGWFVDLISSGERVNVDPQLIFNTLTVAANIPSDDACVIGGSSFLYRFDIGTGGSAYNGSNTVGNWLGNTMIVGLSFVQLQVAGGAAGSGDTITITVDNAGNTGSSVVPTPTSSTGTTKRTSWREIVN